MTRPDGSNPVFEPVLGELSERNREEVLAAYAAVEHSPHPVYEAQLPGLRDATLRHHLERLLHKTGRTLVAVGSGQWTSGYRDDVADELTLEGWHPLSDIDRAVLVLVLIHSVAIPRSQGVLSGDTWVSARPTPAEELFRYAQPQRIGVRAALARLRAAGLVQIAPARGKRSSAGPAYLPGPQLNRLTPVKRRRLQEELILAAAPESPLAAAIRARRADSRGAK